MMVRSQGNNQIAKRNDTLDQLFEWAETVMCPTSMRNFASEPKEDTLDYVFEHVESFTCRPAHEESEPSVLTEIGIQRDNSLVEANAEGRPVRVKTERNITPLGQQGDLVDYVFEHVESFVCNDDIPEDTAMQTNLVARVTPPRRETNDRRNEKVFEPEDEIQLYFRPQRGRRRRKKADRSDR